MATLTTHPNGYKDPSGSTIITMGTMSNAENAYTGVNSTTYATLTFGPGEGYATYAINLTFAPVTLPEDATITGVQCKIKTGALANPHFRLYGGGKQKSGSNQGLNSTSTATTTIDSNTSWSLNDLTDVYLYISYVNVTGTMAQKTLRVYGADLIINYKRPTAINGNVTIGGAQKEIVGAYANIGGTWKEITESYANIGGTWKAMN